MVYIYDKYNEAQKLVTRLEEIENLIFFINKIKEPLPHECQTKSWERPCNIVINCRVAFPNHISWNEFTTQGCSIWWYDLIVSMLNTDVLEKEKDDIINKLNNLFK